MTEKTEFAIQIRPITSKEIYPIRRAVLYPAGPDERIYIPGDDQALHFGAFVTGLQDTNQAQPDEDKLTAVISLFNEDFPSHLYLPDLNSGLNPAESELASAQPNYDAASSTQLCAGSQALRFRKFACLEEFQNRGIGSELFRLVLDHARDNATATAAATATSGDRTPSRRMVWCAARNSAKDWYLKRGMKVYGDTYFESNIEYVIMGIII